MDQPCPLAPAAAALALMLLPVLAHGAEILPEKAGTAGAACSVVTGDTERLACYDRVFRSPDAPSPALHPAPDAPAPRSPEAVAAVAAATAAEPPRSAVARAWELEPDDKRGTFIVRTYYPNYFLPAHYTSSIGVPQSPTHEASPLPDDYKRVEGKIQVSLRAKALEDVGLPGADLWVAYTQRSLWQVWNHPASSPFRSNDYMPEAVYVVPISSPTLSQLPFGWTWRMAQLGIVHQSNGQSDPLSRSWNRVYLGAAIDHGGFGLQWRSYRRVWESPPDDNPDIAYQTGLQEFTASYTSAKTLAALTWRTNIRDQSQGSVQLDWSYPVFPSKPDGLRWYLQLFHGKGETLLDYNHRQTTLGAGLALYQF